MKKTLLTIILSIVISGAAYSEGYCPNTYADCGGWTIDDSGAPLILIELYTCNVCNGPFPGANTVCNPGGLVDPTLIDITQNSDGTYTTYTNGECEDAVTASCQ